MGRLTTSTMRATATVSFSPGSLLCSKPCDLVVENWGGRIFLMREEEERRKEETKVFLTLWQEREAEFGK